MENPRLAIYMAALARRDWTIFQITIIAVALVVIWATFIQGNRKRERLTLALGAALFFESMVAMLVAYYWPGGCCSFL